MKDKKKGIALLAIACSLTFAFASCAPTDSSFLDKLKFWEKAEQEYERQENNLSVETSEYNVKIGETGFIVPTGYTATDGLYLTFTSSNTDVVTINPYGEFTALTEGTATITVKFGTATTEATVNVGWGGEDPRIRMNKEIESSGLLKVSGNDPFDLGLWVYYNARSWSDATYEYTVSDPSVGTVADGKFMPAKNGTTNVTIKATWRGKTCTTMEKTFTVMVGDDVELSVNDGLGGTIQLYTRAEVAGETFATSSPFVITANKKENGVPTALETSVSISEGGEDIIEYDAVNNVVRSKGIAGAAVINVSCTIGENTYTTISTVVVNVSVGDYESTKEVEFSALDGVFFADGKVLSVSEIFAENSVVLTNATADGNELTIGSDNAVLGLKTPNKETLETTVTLMSDSVGYRVPVTAYAKIIDEAEDLDSLCLDVTDYGKSATPRSVEGYYVLAKDIDASDYKMKTQGYLYNESDAQLGGFKGLFDGRGYTISDITFGYDLQLPAATRSYWNNNDYSLFGILGSSAVVKNFALTGVKYDLTNTGGGGDINMSICSPIGSWIFSGATVENVYIGIKGANRISAGFTKIHGFGHQVKLGANLKNIVIDDTYVVTDGDGLVDASAATYKSSFSYRREAGTSSTENNWSNIVVLSKNKLTTNYVNSAFDGNNITIETDSSYFNMPNIYRYETIQEFISANDVDITKFGDVWDKSGYVPVWNGQSLENYLVIELGEQKGDKFEFESSKISEVSVSVSANGQDGVTLNSFAVEGDCVTYANGTLTVNYPGEAVVTANVTYGGKDYELTAMVSVIAPVENYAETVEFSAMHGTLPLADIFGDENTEIVLAYQGDTKLTVKDNKITGLTLPNDKAETVVLTVYSKTKGYNVTCNAYGGIISTAADLEVFNLNMTDYTKMASLTDGNITKELMPLLTGYYVLAGDIDATNYQMQTQGYITGTYNTFMDDLGFKGTFDGRGYTIKGLTLGKDMQLPSATRNTTGGWNKNHYSLFGVISGGGTVKNFALTDVKFDLSNTGGGGDINMSACSPIAMWILNGATVENVYVSVKGYNRFYADGTKISGFAYGVYLGATLKNIVVDDTYTVTDGDGLVDTSAATYRSSFAYRKTAADGATTTNKWTNVVVISSFKLTSTGTSNLYDASNVTTDGYAQMLNTYRYASVAAWETAQADITLTTNPTVGGFGADYWRLVNGVPVWGKAAN